MKEMNHRDLKICAFSNIGFVMITTKKKKEKEKKENHQLCRALTWAVNFKYLQTYSIIT